MLTLPQFYKHPFQEKQINNEHFCNQNSDSDYSEEYLLAIRHMHKPEPKPENYHSPNQKTQSEKRRGKLV